MPICVLQAGSKLKYYNCKNTIGFEIDGKMDDQENEFDKGYCSWDMVTGSSGTYFRTWDPYFKLADLDIPIEEFVEPWYYDDDTPDHFNNKSGAPVLQNGWNMCSGLVNVNFILVQIFGSFSVQCSAALYKLLF